MKLSREELRVIDVACYQLLEALDITKERWEENEELRQDNEKDIALLKNVRQKILANKLLYERCRNCENVLHEYGKGCAWRSLGNEYCFDGKEDADAQTEITKNFNDFQTQIARGLVTKDN